MNVVAFLVQRVGPYHEARFRALARLGTLTLKVIEFRPADAVYAWKAVKDNGDYSRCQARTAAELHQTLREIRPTVIVCVGYADPEITAVVDWALPQRIPLVVCSDSTHDDEPRRWAKEAIKRSVVTAFDAALVSGLRAREYLADLGMREDRCFQAWDVVDNDYFERGAETGRRHEAEVRAKLKLPPHYFLCVARFVTKKNLRRLIEGYTGYVQRAGTSAWSLVLSGAGPLEPELRAAVEAAGLGEHVLFPGFLEYEELPAWYGLAEVAVLPSSSDQWGLVVNEAMAAGLPVLVSDRCGCAPDLVRQGENGFTFSPDDTDAITRQLVGFATLDPARRVALGRRSREIVRAFSPAAFARGIDAAVTCALQRRRPIVSWRTRLLVGALARRSVPTAT